jgi:hypothetical protein
MPCCPQSETAVRRDEEARQEFYDRLEKAGFELDFGADETGLFLKYLRRGSGYYIDVGASPSWSPTARSSWRAARSTI